MVARAYASDIDDFAARLGDMLRRLASLERMVGRGGGGGGTADPPAQFWNSAWGVIVNAPSPATVVTVAATSTPVVTAPAVQLYAGRRYRVRGGIRAWQTTPATANSDLTLVVSGPFAPGGNSHDQYATTGGGYSQGEWVAVFDCTADTPAAVYALTATTTAAATLYGGGNAGLTVEDVGPTVKVVTAPPPSNWAPFDDRYVNDDGDTMTGTLVAPGYQIVSPEDSYGITEFWSGAVRDGWVGKLPNLNDIWLTSDAGLVRVIGGTGVDLVGHTNVIDPYTLSFGSTTRQMLQLYGTSYAMMVQASTFGLRTASTGDFSFYRGGAYSAVRNDPGAGGVEVARLDGSRLRLGGSTDVAHLISNTVHSYLSFFNGTATIAVPGTRAGYVGLVSNNMYLNAEIAGAHMYLMSGSSGVIVFGPGNAEQARFDATGIFLVAKTATSATVLGTEILQTGTVQATRADAGAPYACNKQVGATSGSPMFAWRVDNTQIGSVSRNAATAAVLYNTTSQINLKGRIKRLDGDRALDLVKSWEPIRFQFRYDKKGRLSDKGTPQRDELAGFDAEKMHKLVPYAVAPGHGTLDEHYAWQARKQAEYDAEMAYQAAQAEYERRTEADPHLTIPAPVAPPSPDPYDEDPFTPWGMDHSMLVPDLTAAVQRLAAMVESQATELAELRALVSAK